MPATTVDEEVTFECVSLGCSKQAMAVGTHVDGWNSIAVLTGVLEQLEGVVAGNDTGPVDISFSCPRARIVVVVLTCG